MVASKNASRLIDENAFFPTFDAFYDHVVVETDNSRVHGISQIMSIRGDGEKLILTLFADGNYAKGVRLSFRFVFIVSFKVCDSCSFGLSEIENEVVRGGQL